MKKKKQSADTTPEPTQEAIQAARRIVGRINGRKGGVARAERLDASRLSEIGRLGQAAKNASLARKNAL